MPRKRNDRPGQLGDCWLSQRQNSPVWCRTWLDTEARQVRRASLGTDDFQEAQLRLAQWTVENQRLREEHPDNVPLETILVRYYQGHASALSDQTRSRLAGCSALNI